jgi:hypothetical protein
MKTVRLWDATCFLMVTNMAAMTDNYLEVWQLTRTLGGMGTLSGMVVVVLKIYSRQVFAHFDGTQGCGSSWIEGTTCPSHRVKLIDGSSGYHVM